MTKPRRASAVAAAPPEAGSEPRRAEPPPAASLPHTRSNRPQARWLDALSNEERRALLQVDRLPAIRSLAVNWGLIFASFALVAALPGISSVLVALVVIGARQLGLAILMHEAAHRTLLPDRRWNDRVGRWLAGYPIWADLDGYRPYHLLHHAKTGTSGDPDLHLVARFPITRSSFLRKLGRDLSGRTGIKQARSVLRRDLRAARRPMGTLGRWKTLRSVALTNAILLAGLAVAGHPMLYLLWIGAWLTTYRVCMRIRSIAEHALTPNASDPLGQTRTTLASWWERLLIAPNFVNYHLEHHLMMTVPHDKLPRLHRLLGERGVLDDACVANGYWTVLRAATSKPEARRM